MTLRTPTILAGLAFTLATLSGGAAAQSYPTKPIRMILTYSGGIEAIEIGRAHV